MAARDLRPLLAPRSIAILGASSRPDTIAGRPLASLQQVGYRGSIYPVNPRRDEIAGLRCYASLADLPEPPDVALIVLPNEHVLPAIEASAARGTRAAVVISAGFGETGEAGVRAQQRMRSLAREAGMIVLGPNTMGLVNHVDRIPLTFSSAVDLGKLPPGRIAFVSQSGGLMSALASRATDARLAFSYALNTGNEADLTVAETMEFLADDPQTDVIVAVIEAVRDGDRFLHACERLLVAGKPIVAYKIARSESGGVAARSHTGALTGSYAALQSVFRKYGIAEAADVGDVLDLAAAFSTGKQPAGRRLAVLTESGGAGAIAADRAEENDWQVPAFEAATVARLRAYLPAFAAETVHNPFDATAQMQERPETYGPIAEVLLDSPGVDGLLLVALGYADLGRTWAEALLAPLARTTKPCIQVILGGSRSQPMRDRLRDAGVPVFSSTAKAVDALAALERFARKQERRQAAPEPGGAPDRTEQIRHALLRLGPTPTEYDAKRLLARIGVPSVEERLARSADEAVQHAEALGYPVVLKIQSPQIPHKTEIGGVRLSLTDRGSVHGAYREVVERARLAVPEAAITGVLVARMIAAPFELIAGLHQDPIFGPLVLLGLGGIWAEALQDVAMRPVPIARQDVSEMIGELRATSLLRGARGVPAIQPAAIESVLLALSDLAIAGDGLIESVDVNPLVPTPDGGLVALDASIFLREA